ncbi:MAG: hypothetical protein HY913_04530 [Desulfomonile tiedjei]|nr:hypothetical protein [Desulfomonile tiedjei]
MLEIDDYKNLLTLLQGKPPLWSIRSLNRCVSENLVTQDGSLTRAGTRKAEKLSRGVEALKIGVPLDYRTANHAERLNASGPWYKSALLDKDVFYNSHVLISAYGLTGLSYTKTEIPPDLKWEWQGVLKSTVWRKLEPYAVQIDQFAGHELVCLRSLFDPKKLRIQSVYYDFVVSRWKEASFWYRPEYKDPVVAIKIKPGGIKNSIAMLIMPVKLDLPFPETA